MRPLTIQEFIKKATKTHGSLYEYSEVSYVNSLTKVIILCHKHGEFSQRPSSHIQGAGCPTCGSIKSAQSRIVSLEDFILNSEKIHGDTYEYAKVYYINSRTKVVIICKHHGDFLQEPRVHLSGQGCPKCAGEKSSEARRSTEEFIAKSQRIHGDLYEYAKVIYKASNQKIEVICKHHGEFTQTPSDHLRGSGCPECARLKLGYSKRFYVGHPTTLYVLKLTNGLFKIGITKRSIAKRYSKLEKELIQEVIFAYTDIGNGDSWDLEKLVLREFSKYKYKGEDVLYSGNTELLTVNPTEFLEKRLAQKKRSVLLKAFKALAFKNTTNSKTTKKED